MSALRDTLLAIDHELAAGDGDTYRARLVDEALVIVPGQRMTKEECAAAMDASPGWDEFSIEDGAVVELGDSAALVTYRFSGRRGDDFAYTALMSSSYVRAGGDWQLAFHQQTPLG